ncbi:MAG TPA: BrnA antitoxin family protein [Steroidobacteraceae bacterium]|jgi:uncharacterized protein (DUF4415 family)
MAKGFFARFTRSRGSGESPPAPDHVPPTPDAPTAPLESIARQIARQGLPSNPRKAAISLRLDADVLDWFKAQGPGYQTRINAVLRAYKEAAG